VESSDVLYVVATFLVAGFVKGFCGLGFAAISIGILATFLDLTIAIPLMAVPSIASSFFVMAEAGHFKQALRNNSVLYIALLPGIAIGIALLVLPERNIAKLVLGVLLLAYGAWGLLKPSFKLSETVSRKLRAPIGFLTGAVCGLTGVAVMPLVPYLLSVGLSPAYFIQSINIAFVMCSTILLVSLGSLGYVSALSWIVAIGAIVPVAIAVKGGVQLRLRTSDKLFRIVVLAMLILLGVNLVASAFA
jgi:uncharacterized membrane protein YfcA